jgi:NADPH-dependent 7-cyano-7-deazaguanine reductase QueF
MNPVSANTLETFPNPAPQRDFHIHMEIPEFTCLCPKTGQPDFATLLLDYIPDADLCRTEEPEALHLVFPQYRLLSRGCQQPHPRRPGQRHATLATCD